MARANYDDWTAAVHDELKAAGLDIGDAYDCYSFKEAYEEYDLTPRDAVKDYRNVCVE